MSQVPPPFHGAEGARPKNNTGLIIMIVVAVLVGGCLLAVGMAAFWGMSAFNSGVKPIVGCMVSFQSVHQGLHEYARENGGRLPKADTWQDDLRPYVKKAIENIRKDGDGIDAFARIMNPDGNWGCYTGEGDKMTGMAFNDAFSGIKVDDIESKATSVLIFEIEEPRSNAHEAYRKREESTSPAIFGDHRGWIEVTWDQAEMLSDGQRVRVDVGNSRNRSRAESNPGTSDEAPPGPGN